MKNEPMKREPITNPIILSLALRPALVTFVMFRVIPLDDHYSWFMTFGLILVDTILFTCLAREVYRLKAAAIPEEVDADIET